MLRGPLGLLLSMAASSWGLAGQDCAFRHDPDEYLNRQMRAYREVFRASKVTVRVAQGEVRNVQASEMPRRSFIDEYIFDKLTERNIASAPLAGDEEFLRRVTLDLTGRIPSPADIRAFVGSADADKRDKVIEKLLASPAFVDKWTMYFGDLLKNNSFPSNFDRQQTGRNAFYEWIRSSVAADNSIKNIAQDLVMGIGNHFDAPTAAANWPIASKTPMGPIQDTYDTMLAMTASTFLGLGETDCLLCHSGRGHLEQVNLWASKVTRMEAWRMAAFFSRLNMPQRSLPATDRYYRSFDVSDRATGTYDLNTNWGNRPDRVAVNNVRNITPEYFGGLTPGDGNWRKAFAEFMGNDPMLARNFANRLWKEMFNLALVEPVDSLDPARLDPQNPPAAPWGLQATHPELLEQLAKFLAAYDFNLRGYLRTIVQSTAYQLSSRYDGEWKYEYVNSFARHYPRRMMAEEIHDAVVTSTGVATYYRVTGFEKQLEYAMQLPEPAEPRVDGAAATFLNFFLRGNRDSQPRSNSMSVLQQMNLMNDNFVAYRVKMVTSPKLAEVAKLGSNEEAADELHLLFLSRMPTAKEKQITLDYLSKAANPAERGNLIEDLAWALINKPEFLFSY